MSAVRQLGAAEEVFIKGEQRAARHLLGIVQSGARQGLVLRTQFLLAATMAMRANATPQMREVCARQASQLLKWSKRNLSDPARKAVHEEVLLIWKPVFYSGEALLKDVPELAHLILRQDLVAQLRLDGHLRWHFGSLPGDTSVSAVRATQAWNLLQTRLGGDEALWRHFLDVLVFNRNGLAQQSRAMASPLKAIESMGDAAAQLKAMRQLNMNFGGLRWGVRGKLGELLLSTWPQWQREVRRRMGRARAIAATLPPPGAWQVVYRPGRLAVEGREAWDEAILILNQDSRQAIIDTTAQIKVIPRAGVLAGQTLNDQAREAGLVEELIKGARKTQADRLPSTLNLWNGREFVTYAIQRRADVPPPARYLFYPKGVEPAERSLLKLKARQIDARPYQIDADLATLDALTLHVMKAVEKFDDAVKAGLH